MSDFEGMSRKAIAASEGYWKNRGAQDRHERQEQENIIGRTIRTLDDEWIDDSMVCQILNSLACKCVAAGKHKWAELLDECAGEINT